MTGKETNVEKALEKISTAKRILLFISTPQEYTDMNNTILRYLTNKLKLSGIYVTINKPFLYLEKQLVRDKIDVKKIFFVDAVSRGAGSPVESKNCSFITGAGSLTELSIEIAKKANTGDYQYVLLDSMTTLLMYNSLENTEKFSHYMASKLRALEINGIIISLDDEKSKTLIPLISQLCDECINW